MFLVLFAVGLLIAAAGFVTIGFGIPINAFSLGNTLIIAGTVAVVGGLVLIGLAAAVRQLNRIAEALSRPVARPAAAATAETSNSLVPPTARVSQPPARAPTPVPMPKPVEAAMPRSPEPRPAFEPRFPVAESPSSGPLDWLRPKSKSAATEAPPIAPEPPVADMSEEAPLSPRVPQRPIFSPPQFPTSTAEPPAEPKAWAPSRSNDAPEPKSDLPSAPVPRSEQVARVSPSAMERARDHGTDAKPKDAGLFDVVWPDARSKPMSPSAEPDKREPKAEPPRPPREEFRAEKRTEVVPERVSDRPAAILKSGVIDGMAYTLYVDGSIEAELAQGTVKFASVDALRAHLEKST